MIDIPSAESTADDFEDRYGRRPDGVWSAPGRVNLIGEHTDYNDGLVFPFAIERRTWAAVGHREDRLLTVHSGAMPEPAQASLDALSPDGFDGWSAYVFGVVWAMEQRGVSLEGRTGFDLMLASDVPLGAGLSSSAAIECAVAIALNDEWELGLTRRELIYICQLAENGAVGAPTGNMDQTASLMGEPGHGVLIDVRAETADPVPLHFADEELELLVIDTRVHHEHATGGYGARRKSCEDGAAAMGVDSLRDLGEADLPRALETLDDETYRRVKHVITENARVARTAEVVQQDGPRAIGDLLVQSHASMRDDFEISCPELDLAVETALTQGAVGARMTGGGFGGAAIALVDAGRAEEVGAAVEAAFAESGFTAPIVFVVNPAAGAHRDL
ncbi:galactokinase [Demequina mangrovi]|uniref:Galactokinase n=1 Tax=Demequina mangrovi TaxID=1043493 RepID=A0A1H7AFT3_9MICO|nr:galactokinase [Demequina mangrovi]